MHILKRSKRVINSAVATGATLALVIAPTTAFAHGGSGSDNGSRGGSRTAAAQQQEQRQKQQEQQRQQNFNDWFNRNRDRHKQTCDQRQQALNQKAADAKAKYEKRLTGLNIIYSGVQTYVASGDITVENYDAMNAQVGADQTAATNAVNAIAAPDLNCDDQNAAAATSDGNKTFHDRDNSTNETIKAARDAVNIYRKDLNTLFEAVINS